MVENGADCGAVGISVKSPFLGVECFGAENRIERVTEHHLRATCLMKKPTQQAGCLS